jgi:large subunit ribosomal protein L31
MKPDIHPEYKDTQVTCGCGEKFVTRSTVASGSIYVEVCSVCHPFYTGKQRILDTGGRVAKFEERFGQERRTSFLKKPHCSLNGCGRGFFISHSIQFSMNQ